MSNQLSHLNQPDLTARYLTGAASATAAVGFTGVLQNSPILPASSGADTSVYVVSSIRGIWRELVASPKVLTYSLSLSRSNNYIRHSSQGQYVKKRPDSMVIVNKATLLLGEDRHEDLEAAFRELRSKRTTLLRTHYRDVRFLMGYAAAGTYFQWCFLHATHDKVSSWTGVSRLWPHLHFFGALCLTGHAPTDEVISG